MESHGTHCFEYRHKSRPRKASQRLSLSLERACSDVEPGVLRSRWTRTSAFGHVSVLLERDVVSDQVSKPNGISTDFRRRTTAGSRAFLGRPVTVYSIFAILTFEVY